MINITPEELPGSTAVVSTPPVYRTRSGRNIRRVERYEPDTDTIFIDEDSVDSDYENSENEGDYTSVIGDSDLEEQVDDEDNEEYESSSSEELSELDDSDNESLSDTVLSSHLETEIEEDIDVLNWDTLTIDADSADDMTEEEDEFDDDEEDAL